MGRRLAQVDGHPICAGCGSQITPVTGFVWRHGARPRTQNRWFTPVTPRRLASVSTYEQFGQRFPWAVTSYPGGHTVTTEDDWVEARRRLGAYQDALRDVQRRREPCVGDYAGLVRTLAAADPADADAPVRWRLTAGLAQILRPEARRRELASALAWAVPTAAAIGLLLEHGPLLETGAGTGYWSALLRQAGGDVLAYDQCPVGTGDNSFHPGARAWAPVGSATAVTAVSRHRDRTVFLCWPPYGDDASSIDALRRYRGDTLLYAGDGTAGVTGSLRFHRELAVNWTPVDRLELPGWPGLDDRLSVYRRSGDRRSAGARDICPTCGRFVAAGAIGRCPSCRLRDPAPLAITGPGGSVREYSDAELARLPAVLVRALEDSRGRVRG